MTVSPYPSLSSCFALSNTAGCSTAETASLPLPWRSAAPFNAQLSDSVPPEVKYISSKEALRQCAILSRAEESAAAAARPSA